MPPDFPKPPPSKGQTEVFDEKHHSPREAATVATGQGKFTVEHAGLAQAIEQSVLACKETAHSSVGSVPSALGSLTWNGRYGSGKPSVRKGK